MSNRNIFFGLAACAFLSLAFTLSGTRETIAQPGAELVKVVNSLREPVPTVAQGTTQVSVANTPSVAIHPANNSVQVANTDESPVPVRMMMPARVPFQARASGSFGAGSVAASSLIAVPAGKRLVIEYVSSFVTLPAGQNLPQASIALQAGGTSVQHALRREAHGPHFSGTDEIFVVSEQLRLYADPASTIVFSFARNSTVGTGTVGVTVSGYLEDVQ